MWDYALNCNKFTNDCVERVTRVGVPLYWGGVQRSFQGHIKVISRSNSTKNTMLCLPTLSMRELSVIYDCSWIIRGQALFQKVSQVVLRYLRSTRVVVAPSDFPYFHLRINSLFNCSFSRTRNWMPKVTKYSSVELCLELQQIYKWLCGKGNTGWSSTILRWCAKVIPRSYQGHIKVKLDKKYHVMPSNFIYAWAKCYIWL